jgi:uncharacterized protein (TIRG00374 family)
MRAITRQGRALRMALGWCVAAIFVWLAFRRVPFHEVLHALATAEPGPLWLALAALAADFTLRIARWWWMLRVLEPSLPFGACARPYLVSIAVNNTVPLRAGDVLRAFGFRRALRSAPAAIIGTLLIERLLDFLVLLAALLAGLLVLGRAVLPRPFLVGGAIVGVAGGVGLLALVLAPDALHRIAARLVRALPARWAPRLLTVLAQLFTALGVVRPPRRAMALLALTGAAWALEGAAYACVAWSLHTGGSPFAPWFALATATLATLIPSSPGYVGTFDYFAVLGLTAFGASRVAALTFALLVHLLLWLPVTLVGALYLLTPAERTDAETVRELTARAESS